MQSKTQWNNSWEDLANVIKYDLVPSGMNQGMMYGLASLPPADQLAFLDACHDAGFKVMYDLGTGPVDVNRGGPFDVPALLDDLRRNASLVARHPALLGYYVCDDCCSNNADISLQAQVYAILRDVDPYHVTIGAVNCGNTWMFTDAAPSWLAADQDDAATTIGEGTQPALQLSLDVVLQENYGGTLKQHAAAGTWAGGVGADGWYRHGAEFEPVVNCPGSPFWRGTPAANLASMWLGVIDANMYSNLNFMSVSGVFFIFPSPRRVFHLSLAASRAHGSRSIPARHRYNEWFWKAPTYGAGAKDRSARRMAQPEADFAEEVALLAPAIAAPFGCRHPVARVVEEPGKSDVRARAWAVPAAGGGEIAKLNCTAVAAAVNVDEASRQEFALAVDGLSVASMTPLFEGAAACVSVGDWSFLAAGARALYCLKPDPCPAP